ATGRLVYTGAIDDNPRSEDEVEQPYLAEVLTALRQGTAPPVTRTDPYGCLIKFVKP
ncbi:MAG: thioredoxin family protein, partial [Bacteroidetes bacterium]